MLTFKLKHYRDYERLALHVECAVCGHYLVSLELYELLKDPAPRNLLPYLAAHLRQATDAGEEVAITTDNWETLARAHMGIPVSQKVQRLLEYVATRSAIGEWLRVEQEAVLCALLDMRGPEELGFVLGHLSESGLLERGQIGGVPDGQGGTQDTVLGLQLTVSGWNIIAPASGGVPGTCFVAMSFDPSLDTAFSVGIVPAVETDCGFRVIRIDRVHHNEAITDRIIGGIRSSQFLIADFTLQRQGVYYEAGFAQGLGRTVIRTCRSDHFEGLHFDTRQFFHLRWDTPEDLRIRLAEHIRATISK